MGEQISVGQFEATFRNLKTPIGLVIDEARLTGVNTVVQMDPLRIEMLEPGTIEAKIGEQALAVFLEQKAPGGMRGFEIALKAGKVYVQASITMIIPMKVSAVCSLRIQDERQIFVDLGSVDVMGVGATGLVEGHIARINPVLDVADLPINVRLKTIEVVDGKVVVKGEAKPNQSA